MPVSVGTTIADPHVRQALAVLAALPAALRRTALGARATDTSIIVYESGGLRIEFGDGSELGAKALALKAVLSRYRTHHVTCTYVDVSVPDRPLGAPLLPPPATQSGTPAGTPSHTPSATPKSTPSGKPSATKSATPGTTVKPTGTPTTVP